MHSLFREQIECLTITKNLIVNTLSYKTVSANKDTAVKEWLVVDADGQTLARLPSKITKLNTCKNKPNKTPNVYSGDNVVEINSEKIKFTGKKCTSKSNISHTGYPGGERSLSP